MQEDDVTQVTVATFDRLAKPYAEKYFHLDLYDPYLENFASCIAAGPGNVLDVACGPGNVAAYLARRRPELNVLGIDLAEGMLSQARGRVPSAEFLSWDCRRIDELGQVFIAVAFAFGLSYLTDEDAGRFFAALNGSLADSGVLYLSTLTGDPEDSGLETSVAGDRVYVEYRRIEEVLSRVESAGYHIEQYDVLDSPANASTQTRDLILIARKQS